VFGVFEQRLFLIVCCYAVYAIRCSILTTPRAPRGFSKPPPNANTAPNKTVSRRMQRSTRLILLACACGPSAAQMPIVPSRAAERPDPTKEMSACATMGPWIGCVFALYEDTKAELQKEELAGLRASASLEARGGRTESVLVEATGHTSRR
jgi:hypothetical protein